MKINKIKYTSLWRERSKVLIIEKNNIKKKGGVFSNKTLMFTGKLDNISRAEAKSIVENNGGKIVSNVSKKLDYLISIGML